MKINRLFAYINRNFLVLVYIPLVAHTIKDIFQDFLEMDVLYFVDANENLLALPQWGRWLLATANYAATAIGLVLVVLTPLAFRHHRPRLQKILLIGYLFFFTTLATDLLLDPRIANPRQFFDKSTRTPAHQVKTTYWEVFTTGPF